MKKIALLAVSLTAAVCLNAFAADAQQPNNNQSAPAASQASDPTATPAADATPAPAPSSPDQNNADQGQGNDADMD